MSKTYEVIRQIDGAQIGEQIAGNDFAKKKLGKAADLLKDGKIRVIADDGVTQDASEEPPVAEQSPPNP